MKGRVLITLLKYRQKMRRAAKDKEKINYV